MHWHHEAASEYALLSLSQAFGCQERAMHTLPRCFNAWELGYDCSLMAGLDGLFDVPSAVFCRPPPMTLVPSDSARTRTASSFDGYVTNHNSIRIVDAFIDELHLGAIDFAFHYWLRVFCFAE